MPIKEVEITDASHWRWPTPLPLLIADGQQGFITKCTEGTTWVDDYYDDWQVEADNFEFPFGSFHYWRAGYDAYKQAKHYFDIATAWKRPVFPPAIDIEKYNNTGVLTLSAASAHLHLTVMETERLWGEKPSLYTNYYSVKDMLGNPSWMGEYPLWVASYRNDRPAIPLPWQSKPAPQYGLWQDTKSNPIPGAAFKGYDRNWFKGTQAEYDAYVASRTSTTPPPPAAQFPFMGKVSLPANLNIFNVPMGEKIGLIPHEAGVAVLEELRDTEQIKWYKLGNGSFVKAKYIIPME